MEGNISSALSSFGEMGGNVRSSLSLGGIRRSGELLSSNLIETRVRAPRKETPVRPPGYRYNYDEAGEARISSANILSESGGWPEEMDAFPHTSQPHWPETWGEEFEWEKEGQGYGHGYGDDEEYMYTDEEDEYPNEEYEYADEWPKRPKKRFRPFLGRPHTNGQKQTNWDAGKHSETNMDNKDKVKSDHRKTKRIRIRRKKKPYSMGSVLDSEREDDRNLINFVPEKYLDKKEVEEIRYKKRIRAKKPYQKGTKTGAHFTYRNKKVPTGLGTSPLRSKRKKTTKKTSQSNVFTRLLAKLQSANIPPKKKQEHYHHRIDLPTLSKKKPTKKKIVHTKKKRPVRKKPKKAYVGQPDRFEDASWPSMTGIMHGMLGFLSKPGDYAENFQSYFAGGPVKKPQNYGGSSYSGGFHGGSYGGGGGGGGGGGNLLANFIGENSLSRQVILSFREYLNIQLHSRHSRTLCWSCQPGCVELSGSLDSLQHTSPLLLSSSPQP